MNRLAATLRRLPLSIPASLTITGFQAATALRPGLHPWLLRNLGLHWPSLAALHVHRVPLSALIQPNPGFSLAGMLAAFVAPIAEWRLGTRWMAVVFFGSDALSTLSILGLLRAAHVLGVRDTSSTTHVLDAGSSSAATATV